MCAVSERSRKVSSDDYATTVQAKGVLSVSQVFVDCH